MKCDYCSKPAKQVTGEQNHILVCADHAAGYRGTPEGPEPRRNGPLADDEVARLRLLAEGVRSLRDAWSGSFFDAQAALLTALLADLPTPKEES